MKRLTSKIQIVLPLAKDVREGLGFDEGVYAVSEHEGEGESEGRCEHPSECLELARNFKVRLEAVLLEGEEIPIARYEDIMGFLEKDDREIRMCFMHMAETVIGMQKKEETDGATSGI